MIKETVERLGIKSGEAPVKNPGQMQFGALGEISLPDDLIAIYEMGDGIRFQAYPGMMIPYATAKSLRRPDFKPSVYDVWPFFTGEGDESSEVSVIVHGPAKGYVMQQVFDGSDRILAPNVLAFFEMLAQQPPSVDFFGSDDETWIYPKELLGQDRTAVEELLSAVDRAEDSYEGESLASLAMSMMTDEEFVERFADSLFSIENFRAVVWGRLLKIDSDAARAGCRLYQADYEDRTRPKDGR